MTKLPSTKGLRGGDGSVPKAKGYQGKTPINVLLNNVPEGRMRGCSPRNGKD